MIYLVSNEQFLFPSTTIQQVSVEESLKLLEPLQTVGLDTETSGLSSWSDNLLLVQLGNKDFQVVIDCKTIDIILYKDFLESDRLFLLWNALFDLQWFYKHGIIIKRVYDGMLAEKLLWLGYPKGMHSMSLKSAGYNYLNIELDKSVRGKIIWTKTLTEEIIVYGAEDVAHLEDIMNEQYKKLVEQELLIAIDIENRFVRVLAYIEWCGVKVDTQKWSLKMKDDLKRLEEARDKCNQWLIDNYSDSEFVYTDIQGDLFSESPFDLTPKVSLNWNSPQVKKVFKHFGVNLTDPKEGKDSLEAKILKPQSSKCSLIPLFLDYKEAFKVCSTYGEKFLNQINPISGRLHADWNCIGTDTGRVSCGGSDEEESINLLNLPADEITRACFVAEEGNKWISVDYSGQESFIMASIANDKAMINELMYGEKDLHTLTAKLVFSYIPKDMSAKEVKQKYHKERSNAKGYEFAFNYAGNASTIQRNFGLTEKEATRIYDSYMSGFNGLKKYQDFRKKDWFDKGYILLSPLSKYRAHIYDYNKLIELKNSFTKEFWDIYRQIPRDESGKKAPRNATESLMCENVKTYFKRRADSDRQSVNYPIQHAGAMCSKVALINFFDWIVEQKLFNIVKITIIPYDEINCEAPESIAELVATTLYNFMVDSGKIFCTRCKLDADMSRLDDGSLPNYWIH